MAGRSTTTKASTKRTNKSNAKLPPSASKTKKPPPASKKRKLVDFAQDDNGDEDGRESESGGKKQKKSSEEKRLKAFRKKAPQSFLLKLQRAQTQRMIVIGRARSGQGLELHENIDIVGTTGNIYTVTIGRLPSCTCPDHQKGHECKHKVYALSTVLRASYELQYQMALLSSEIEDIFAAAPPIPGAKDNDEDHDGKRKPIEGECPICYMDYDPDNNELVWCKAGCGNNMHKDCFEQWAASQRGKEVRCVYCRTPWPMDTGDIASIKKAGEASGDGYINVAEQFGISRARDYSTYYQPWARRSFGYG